MIIKKPYAFLIKHFRMIHLFLFAGIAFIALKSTSLMNFFNDYVKNGFYTYTNNLTSSFINLYSFLIIIAIVVFGIIIYILLKWKDKKRTLYVALCSFYLVLFIVFIFYFGVLNTIQSEVLDIRTIRLYRDVIIIFTLPQYFFIVVAFIRAIGFDIKKFNFTKDIAELEIDAPDYEEVEITFGKDSYKYKRKVRRTFREFKYYVLENKFFFLVACSLVVVSLSLGIYLNFEVFNKKYTENAYFSVDGVNFNVLDSYSSNVDYKGDEIIKGKNYIVIKLQVNNNTDNKKILETEDIRLLVGKNEYVPVFSKNNHFVDLGEGYNGQTLYPGESYEYLLVFEIPLEDVKNSYTFRLINKVDYLRGEINARHKDVIVNPQVLNSPKVKSNYKLHDYLDLGLGTLENSNAIIMSYDIKDAYTVNYDYCVQGKCYVGKKVIKSSIVGKIPQVVMKLETDFNLNSNLYINKYIKKSSDFISMFGKIRYKIDGVLKSANLTKIDYEYINEGEVYLEVPKEVTDASDITLDLTIRHINFSVNLKGDV